MIMKFAYGWSIKFGLCIRKLPDRLTVILHLLPLFGRTDTGRIRYGGIGIHFKQSGCRGESLTARADLSLPENPRQSFNQTNQTL